MQKTHEGEGLLWRGLALSIPFVFFECFIVHRKYLFKCMYFFHTDLLKAPSPVRVDFLELLFYYVIIISKVITMCHTLF